MIRRAKDGDDLRALWRLCFDGDTGEEFFGGAYRPERSLVFERQGVLLAMLHSIPKTLVWQGEELPALYLLGVATHPNARGGGLAYALLEQVLREAQDEAFFASFLIPAKASLISYYERLGFHSRASRPVCAPPIKIGIRAQHGDIAALMGYYDRLPQRVRRDTEDWERIVNGYEVYLAEGGYHVRDEGEWIESYPPPVHAAEHPLAACIKLFDTQAAHRFRPLTDSGDTERMPYINLLYN